VEWDVETYSALAVFCVSVMVIDAGVC